MKGASDGSAGSSHLPRLSSLGRRYGTCVITKLFQDRGYGFLESEDGREIYFHKNSVLDGRFEKLQIGAKVRYAEEDGDKGPQASTVHVNGSALS